MRSLLSASYFPPERPHSILRLSFVHIANNVRLSTNLYRAKLSPRRTGRRGNQPLIRTAELRWPCVRPRRRRRIAWRHTILEEHAPLVRSESTIERVV